MGFKLYYLKKKHIFGLEREAGSGKNHEPGLKLVLQLRYMFGAMSQPLNIYI